MVPPVPPSQKHLECHVKVIPQRLAMGTERGMAVPLIAIEWQCLLPPSLFVSALSGPGRAQQGKARHDSPSLLCHCSAPPAPAGDPCLPLPIPYSCCLNDPCSSCLWLAAGLVPGRPNVRGETEVQAPLLQWCLVIPARHGH